MHAIVFMNFTTIQFFSLQKFQPKTADLFMTTENEHFPQGVLNNSSCYFLNYSVKLSNPWVFDSLIDAIKYRQENNSLIGCYALIL